MGLKAGAAPLLGGIRGALASLRSAAAARIGRVRADKRLCWMLATAAKWLLLLLCLAAWTIAAARFGQKKALAEYRVWFEQYKADQAAAAAAAVESDPYTLQLNAEAEQIARVLYGVKDNSTDDLKTACWCVFNRVDNPIYPDTLTEVIAQPSQWMRYSEENPVLDSLYKIAREQLDRWHSLRRPVSSEYVYMSWSENDICLRDKFIADGSTKYWRYKQ